MVSLSAQAKAPQPIEAGHTSTWLLDGLHKAMHDVNAACISSMQRGQQHEEEGGRGGGERA